MSCKVIAHRGSNKVAPQNTLPAFRRAIEEGTNGFETDVHLSRDGKLVICHNYTIDKTSDGTGYITSFTSDELKKYDFGAYFGEEFVGTRIPTLEEFLELTAPTDTDIINLELKSPKNRSREMVMKTMDVIKKYGVLDRIIISSFDGSILKTVKKIEPACKTAFLYPSTNPNAHRFEVFPFATVKNIGAEIIHPASVFVNKVLVTTAHKLGLQVNVWTVNDEATVRRLLACGVDGIITDCPGIVRGFIDKYESEMKEKAADAENMSK